MKSAQQTPRKFSLVEREPAASLEEERLHRGGYFSFQPLSDWIVAAEPDLLD